MRGQGEGGGERGRERGREGERKRGRGRERKGVKDENNPFDLQSIGEPLAECSVQCSFIPNDVLHTSPNYLLPQCVAAITTSYSKVKDHRLIPSQCRLGAIGNLISN